MVVTILIPVFVDEVVQVFSSQDVTRMVDVLGICVVISVVLSVETEMLVSLTLEDLKSEWEDSIADDSIFLLVVECT